jgi:hypothetical protein
MLCWGGVLCAVFCAAVPWHCEHPALIAGLCLCVSCLCRRGGRMQRSSG